MPAETSQVPGNPSECLIKILFDEDEVSTTSSSPRIKKVSTMLRNIKPNDECVAPSVVSLGPLHSSKNPPPHSGKDPLHSGKHPPPHSGNLLLNPKYELEDFKKVTARWFISLATRDKKLGDPKKDAKKVYLDFVKKAKMDKSFFEKFYGNEIVDKFPLDELSTMMFLDGCFILHFIHLVLKGSDDMLKKSSYLDRSLILNDMFLLENQIPYSILEALMALKGEHEPKKEIVNFIHKEFIPQNEFHFSVITIIRALFCPPVWLYSCFVPWFHSEDPSDGHCKAPSEGGDPVHLLGHLQSILTGGSKEARSSSKSGSGQSHYNFRPIRELQATGIQVSRSNSSSLKDVKFSKGIINSHLELPAIVIDDSSKTRLLNLAAYEICDNHSDQMVTSYICFLRSLIYHPTDVKELRSKEIIINHHGSDAQVSTILKDVAKNLSPNYDIYRDVIKGIEGHMTSRHSKHVRLWIGQLKRRYFTSPWTVMSLIAAILLLILTLTQTVYSVLSYNKSN